NLEQVSIDLSYLIEFRAELINQITYRGFLKGQNNSLIGIPYRFNDENLYYYEKLFRLAEDDSNGDLKIMRRRLVDATSQADIFGFAKVLGEIVNDSTVDPLPPLYELDFQQKELKKASNLAFPESFGEDLKSGLVMLSTGAMHAKL